MANSVCPMLSEICDLLGNVPSLLMVDKFPPPVERRYEKKKYRCLACFVFIKFLLLIGVFVEIYVYFDV